MLFDYQDTQTMPDFYFRGTLIHYWQFTYTEYNRLSSIFGKECFEFFEPDPKIVSLVEYQPKYYDQVHFIIWEQEHRDFSVRVRAGNALSSELVEMHVSIYVDVLKTLGDSCLDVWNAYVKSLEEHGLLLKPTYLLASLPSKPPRPKSKSVREAWLIYYELMNKRGYKYTLKQLAKELNISEGHAKRLHADFSKRGEVE